MEKLNILIAEDDPWYSEFIEYHLTLKNPHTIKKVSTAKELQNALQTKPDIITLDYHLPDKKGDVVLKQIKMWSPNSVVVLISGQEDINTALDLIKEGAFDYIVKNEDAKNRIQLTLSKIIEHLKLKTRIENLELEVGVKYDLSKTIIGKSKAINGIYKFIDKAISSAINVSITGETGTGKEVVAKSIHYNSQRRKAPFVAVNLSAIPEDLIESELFGHAKGAYTGADKARIGRFEEAANGTIFLDEIGEISLYSQLKLLRVLQEREFSQLGSNKKIPVNCRIICATHKDLSVLVAKELFREDLYYRLMGIPIHLAPLSERENDTAILAKFFVENYCKEQNLEPKVIHPDAMQKLLEHSFPGNVRELKSLVELACVMSNGQEINKDDLLFSTKRNLDDLINSTMTLKEINEKIILRLLNLNHGEVAKVSKQLDIGKSSIYRLLQDQKIESKLSEAKV